MNGQDDLAGRIVRLDRKPDNSWSPLNQHPDIVHFIRIMSGVTSTGIPPDPDRTADLLPSDADAMVAECALLDRVEAIAPDIVSGPLSVGAQFWTGTGKPSHVPPGERRLSRHHFIPLSAAANIEVSTKPFGVGLFTSTGVTGATSMWRTYLDLHDGSILFPPPWWTWSVTVEPGIAVYEINTAARWVELVSSWPTRHAGLLYPDWAAIGARYDAVHVTMRAIAAAQGLCLPTPSGPVAPPYWDVESTFWLHWRFAFAELVERRPAAVGH